MTKNQRAMHLNYTALVIPVFCLLVWLEYRISLKKGIHAFSAGTTLANVHIGILERLTDVIAAGAFYGVYVWLHEEYALFHFTPQWWMWIVLLLITDFIWYWYHRLAHEFNVFWSVHVVHHQSEAFNYSVSARITLLLNGAILEQKRWIFYLEIARVVGVAGILLYPFNTPALVLIAGAVLLISANYRWVKLKYILWVVR